MNASEVRQAKAALDQCKRLRDVAFALSYGIDLTLERYSDIGNVISDGEVRDALRKIVDRKLAEAVEGLRELGVTVDDRGN